MREARAFELSKLCVESSNIGACRKEKLTYAHTERYSDGLLRKNQQRRAQEELTKMQKER